MNTKSVEKPEERKALKRAARRRRPRRRSVPRAWRAARKEEDPTISAGPAQALIGRAPVWATFLRTRSIDALIAASEDPEQAAAQDAGSVEPDRFRYRRRHRLRHFHFDRHGGGRAELKFKSILNAPILDLLLNGGNAVSTIGRQGAGPGISLSFSGHRVRVQFRGAVLRGTGVDDSRSPGARTRTPTRSWARFSRGSSAGT